MEQQGSNRNITTDEYIAIEAAKMLVINLITIIDRYFYTVAALLRAEENELEVVHEYLRGNLDGIELTTKLGVKIGGTQEQEQGEAWGAGAVEGTDGAATDHSSQDGSV
jgi:hypothetical protein